MMTMADLYALPPKSIVVTGGHIFEKFADGKWFTTGTDFAYSAGTLVGWGPTVLFRPDVPTLPSGDWCEILGALFGWYPNDPERGAQPGTDDVMHFIDYLLDAEREHIECPHYCGVCGETLARTLCARCGGDGQLRSGEGASECPECAGAGWLHDGCAGKSYAELASPPSPDGAA